MDLGPRLALVVAMTGADELHADTIDLITQLCTRVGMFMEDAAPLALHRSQSEAELKSRLLQLHASATSIASLIAAARVLAKV